MHQLRYILLLLLVGSHCCLPAQNLLLEQADKAMQELDFVTATAIYQQILSTGSPAEAKIGLAECFRRMNDTESAARWYAEVVKLNECKPKHRLYYGLMLQAQGRCEEARHWLAQYATEMPDDVRGQNALKGCDQAAAIQLAGQSIYSVFPLPINSNMDDFAPALRGKQLIFTSDRRIPGPAQRSNMWTGSGFTDLYTATFQATPAGAFLFTPAQPFAKELNSKFHEAAATFSPDGRTVYFTRNNYLNGKTNRDGEGLIKLKIFVGNADERNTWGNLQALSFCSDQYSSAHPALSTDGNRLFFASNMPGGYGGMDLYMCEWEGSRWGLPINLGPDINTEGNELFPFLDANGRLYFASNGHIGLGGLDNYYSTPRERGNWNKPVNLGGPVNSNHDDFGLVLGPEGDWGFFSSDRPGGAGRDDVYGFRRNAVSLEIVVRDSFSKKPLAGVQIRNNTSGQTFMSSKDGRVMFDLALGDCVALELQKQKYDLRQLRYCAQKAGSDSLLIHLERQGDYVLQGMVFDMVDGMPADGAKLLLTNNCGEAVPEIFTTAHDGRFRFPLGKNCCYSIKAFAEGYISDLVENLCTSGLPPETVLRTELSLEPYRDRDGFVLAPPMNTPTPTNPPQSKGDFQRSASGDGFIVNLYYDFNAADLRPESTPELQRLLRLLRENPDLYIEIASHTDARGAADYNRRLSQRRAETVVEWLVREGIPTERLSARGYGEAQPVNDCGDDKPCTEAEHQLNRRTEFRVLGENTLLSKPKLNPKTAPCKGCPF